MKPKGALYMFPKIDTRKFNIQNDEKMIYDILTETRTLLVQGTGFNWKEPDHFRMVFLPDLEVLSLVANRLKAFFESYIPAAELMFFNLVSFDCVRYTSGSIKLYNKRILPGASVCVNPPLFLMILVLVTGTVFAQTSPEAVDIPTAQAEIDALKASNSAMADENSRYESDNATLRDEIDAMEGLKRNILCPHRVRSAVRLVSCMPSCRVSMMLI